MFALLPRSMRRMELLPRTEALLERIPEEFETLWNRLISRPMMEVMEPTYRWDMNMEERENEVIVRAELPGFAPEEVRVEMLGGRLTIEAEHKVPAEETERKPTREYARVRRVFTVPPGINPEGVEAALRNGVLEIHLPRTPEATPRRIEVKV